MALRSSFSKAGAGLSECDCCKETKRPQMNLKELGIDVSLAVAGLFGSVLTSTKRSGENIPRTIASLVGGAASANYVTPLLLKIGHIDNTEPSFGYAAAFLLGFCGLRAVETLSQKIMPQQNEQPTTTRTSKRHR